jgi:hypothetical protein
MKKILFLILGMVFALHRTYTMNSYSEPAFCQLNSNKKENIKNMHSLQGNLQGQEEFFNTLDTKEKAELLSDPLLNENCVIFAKKNSFNDKHSILGYSLNIDSNIRKIFPIINNEEFPNLPAMSKAFIIGKIIKEERDPSFLKLFWNTVSKAGNSPKTKKIGNYILDLIDHQWIDSARSFEELCDMDKLAEFLKKESE